LIGRAFRQQHLVPAPRGHPAHVRPVRLGAELDRAAGVAILWNERESEIIRVLEAA